MWLANEDVVRFDVGVKDLITRWALRFAGFTHSWLDGRVQILHCELIGMAL